MAVQAATSTGPECEHEACGPYRWIGGMHQGQSPVGMLVGEVNVDDGAWRSQASWSACLGAELHRLIPRRSGPVSLQRAEDPRNDIRESLRQFRTHFRWLREARRVIV